jgi:hypothetical protein
VGFQDRATGREAREHGGDAAHGDQGARRLMTRSSRRRSRYGRCGAGGGAMAGRIFASGLPGLQTER